MTHGDGGKGDTQRPTDQNKFSSNYDLIWGKKKRTLKRRTKSSSAYNVSRESVHVRKKTHRPKRTPPQPSKKPRGA